MMGMRVFHLGKDFAFTAGGMRYQLNEGGSNGMLDRLEAYLRDIIGLWLRFDRQNKHRSTSKDSLVQENHAGTETGAFVLCGTSMAQDQDLC